MVKTNCITMNGFDSESANEIPVHEENRKRQQQRQHLPEICLSLSMHLKHFTFLCDHSTVHIR
jgi:hypothetical protein